ncbi:hypothetical protein FP435_07280 [Lactobacillus sp. PV037]|uniref:hypothetical protein n=1 Tax=unclassified Lactobacillus TaxID=2620435 RepID=UPI00223FE63B|nr:MULTISPECIES: hypothetical protein [unclassified Lactobacillus]QNQ81723.1 hypothetical protein FP433_00970 [Lactobacillus sp. PV012]QNQ84232.1 hypothetical protein FP435_07280 [Lactobacillus sp. PV037]
MDKLKILVATGAGQKANEWIKEVVEGTFKQEVLVDTADFSTVTETVLNHYDAFLTAPKHVFKLKTQTPIVEASGILYRVPSLGRACLEDIAELLKKTEKKRSSN